MATLGVVGLSGVFLPSVGGYGTVLFQNVVLFGAAIAGWLTSEAFTLRNRELIWGTALVLNVAVFAVPATIIWLISRKWWPRVSVALLCAWCAFYVASLFILFPATDGP
jgi:hypothetical protein